MPRKYGQDGAAVAPMFEQHKASFAVATADRAGRIATCGLGKLAHLQAIGAVRKLVRVVRDLLRASRSSNGLSMDAIALPIVAGPTAMPIPSGEGPLADASSFGALVAAVAKGNDQQATTASERPANLDAAPLDAASDVPLAFAVRQWFAQTDSPPPLSKGLSFVLEKFTGNSDPSAAPASSPALSAINQERVESDSSPKEGIEGTDTPVTNNNPSKS